MATATQPTQQEKRLTKRQKSGCTPEVGLPPIARRARSTKKSAEPLSDWTHAS